MGQLRPHGRHQRPARGRDRHRGLPSGLAVTCSRDGNGRVSGITAGGQTVAGNVSYMPFGPVKGMTLGSMAVSRSFNQRYLMTGIAAGSVMNLAYTYDGAGNVKTTTGLARPPLVPGTTDYAHTANRLVSSSGFSAKSYSYDNVGNIKSDGVRTFDYDQSNRLIRVTEGGAVLAEYAYDAFNRRVKKTVDGEAVYFHYDADGLLICETDASGNAIRDYVYLNGEPAAMRVSGSWYWFLNDHLGTPQKIVDASGAVVWEAAYLPFGKARVLTAAIENHLRFPGQYFDEETGLHYNWHRYYDPELGRYITADPIGLDGGINLYTYVSNNPATFFDPYGLFTASDIASSWQSSAMESSAGLDQMVSDSPGLWAAAATVQTLMDVGGGFVDMLRFGEGAAEGGICGYGKDALRGIGLVGSMAGATSRAMQAVKGGAGIKYHYTNAPEESFKNGLWRNTSVTDNGNLGATEASQKLGIPKPDKVIPIRDNGHFVPNKPHIVEWTPKYSGGGKDFINPNPIPKKDIRPAYPIKKP